MDFSGEFILREVFWMGRSNCHDPQDPNGFECNNAKWITKDGWHEVLRGLVDSAMDDTGPKKIYKKKLLWLYVPDYERNGAIHDILSIPNRPRRKNVDGLAQYWVQEDACSGF